MIQYKRKIIVLICGLLLFSSISVTAAPKTTHYNIPSQNLSKALRTFARKANISLIFSNQDMSRVLSQKLSGTYSIHSALNILLSHTKFSFKVEKGKTYYIVSQKIIQKISEVNNDNPTSDFRFEEVIVTALRRTSSLQNTPISITALTGERLTQMGAFDIMDYAGFVSGLTVVDTGPGQRRLVIRGIQGIGEAQVGLYYGEVPVTGTPGPETDAGTRQPEILLFDTDRIEILKGPQGTLYGSGSMSGTVRIIFREPNLSDTEKAFDGRISQTRYGKSNYQLHGRFNLPLVTDKVAFRAVGYYQSNSGYVDSVPLNLKDINSTVNWGTRLQLKVQPKDSLSVLFTAILQRMNLQSLNHWYPSDTPFQNEDLIRSRFRDKTDIFNLKITRHFSEMVMQFSSSYYQRDIIHQWDTSNLFINLDRDFACRNLNAGGNCNTAQISQTDDLINTLLPLIVHQPQELANWTNEIRLRNEKDGPLSWTMGAFLEKRSASFTSQIFHVEDPTGKATLSQKQLHRNSTEELRQIAFFGEIEYAISNKFSVTFGSRYFMYSKEITGETLSGIPLLNIIPRAKESIKFDEGQWLIKMHAAYRFNEDILVYAQASEGYRIGGANQLIGLPENLTPYAADSLWNYEIGAKTSWLDKRLILNSSVYWIDWNNMQVRGVTKDGTFGFVSNAGAARIKGGEIELSLYPLERLLLSLSLNYNDAQLVENQTNPFLREEGRKGDRIPFVPKLTYSVYSQYEWPIKTELKATLMASLRYVGQSNSDFNTDAPFNEKMGDYMVINLRAGLAYDNWNIYLFADNVFDTLALTRRRSSEFWDKQSFSLAPRTIGIGIRGTF